VAVAVISHALPKGFSDYMSKLASDPKTRFPGHARKMPPQTFWSYTLIPLSSIMFPHMAIMCFSARRVTAFKQHGHRLSHRHHGHLAAVRFSRRARLCHAGQNSRSRRRPAADVANKYAPAWLAGVLGAGIISAVMGSDAHQVLALSTMFTKDVFAITAAGEIRRNALRPFCARLYRGGHDHRLFGRAGAEGKAGHFRDRHSLTPFPVLRPWRR
jgi:solute:Na+ symporter, SSS family